MESLFVCQCQMNFPSINILENHRKVCPFINTLNSNLFSIQAVNKNIIQATAAMEKRNKAYIASPQIVKKCVIDSNIITKANRSMYEDICSNEECISEYNIKCKKALLCGHQCYGSTHDECLNCLNLNCHFYKNYFNQNSSTLCAICLTDNLESYSIVQLVCKHYMHRKCLLRRLKLKWPTQEINFNYQKCVVCNYSIEYNQVKGLTNDEEFLTLIKESNSLYYKIKNISDLLNENELEPIPMEKFSFYICDKCLNPYCSGLKECREEIEVGQKPARLCIECIDYTSLGGMTHCDNHGRDNIQYKCKFCCNLASHFCFGTTHFCEECHLEQFKGNYLTSKNKDELQKCEGITSCPVGIEHPINGEEFGMYCILCIK